MIRIRPLLQSIAGALFITAQAYAAPPTIGETPTQSIEIQQTFVQQVQASDPEGGSLIYTLAYGPENMTISSSGLIEWETSATDAGSHDYKVWVEDDEALTAFQHFTVEVNDPNNNPPVFNGSPTESTTINTLYTFDASATDPDGDTIEYTINAWPVIEALSIDANGQVAWFTTDSDVGAYTVWVTADDGKLGSTKLLFQLEVHDPSNQAPVINGTPNNETYVGAVYEFDINAHDPDGDSLSYQVAGWPEATGIAVDEHGLVTWQPTADQVGEYWLWVTVDDQRLGVTKEAFELRVIDPANTPPVIFNKSQDVVLNVGQAYTHDLQAADADGDPINYQLNTWPQDYGITLSNTGIVSWTPTSAHLGDVYLMIKIDDGRLGEDNHSYKITIVNTGNNPPNITSSPLTSVEVNTAYQYTITAEDPENNALTFALRTAPAGMSIDANSGLITWAPTTVGNYPVTATASDGINPAVTQSYTLTVSPPANTAPLANNQNVTTAEDTAISITLSASDNEGDVLTFNVLTNVANGTFTGTAPNLTYTPSSNFSGSDSFTFQVNDGSLDSDIATVDIVITPVNDAPTATPLNISTEEDSPINVTLSGSDIENDSLHFVIDTQPANGTLSGTVPNLSYTPNQDFNGDDAFMFYVNDGVSHSSSVAISISVVPMNDAPEFTSEGVQSVVENSTYYYDAQAADVDLDTLTYSLNVGPANLTIHEMTGELTWVPTVEYVQGIDAPNLNCVIEPMPIGEVDPVLKWEWTGSAVLPDHSEVIMSPSVAQTTDDNGDGLINNNDIPDVIFISYRPNPYFGDGVLRIISGEDGSDIVTNTDVAYRLGAPGHLAVGDIDLDGFVEIVAVKQGGGIVVFEHDGSFKWQVVGELGGTSRNWGAPAIADIDEDGVPEIIFSEVVINNNGTVRWIGRGGFYGHNYPDQTFSDQSTYAIDLDPLSAGLELVAGASVYDNFGNILWINSDVGDGLTATADVLGDANPELVHVSGGVIHLLDNQGQVLWGPIDIPGGGNGGTPTVGDMDGDSRLEIGVATDDQYVVFNHDGSILWQASTQDMTSSTTGSSLFDFNGDGRVEVVYSDEIMLRVFDGSSGQEIYSIANDNGTWREQPVIVDVDNDAHADIIVGSNRLLNSFGTNGIRVFEGGNNSWVNTRKIWNQHAYYISNVNDDGSIPQFIDNPFVSHNSFRVNSIPGINPLSAIDLRVGDISITSNNELSVEIKNNGAIDFEGETIVAFYHGEPDQGEMLGSATIDGLEVGSQVNVLIPILGVNLHDDIFVVVNESQVTNECQFSNNVGRAALISLNVEDPWGLNDTQIYLLNVRNVNANPEIENSQVNYQLNEGALFRLQIAATDEDLGDVVTYSLLGAPSGMTIDAKTGEIEWLPGSGDIGEVSVDVMVVDLSGGTNTLGFTFTVLGNEPPVFTSEPEVVALEGELYRYATTAIDVNGDLLTYGATLLPSGAHIDSVSGVINWEPSSDYVQSLDVSNLGCLAPVPDRTLFSPVVKWAWTESQVEPEYIQVIMTPMVAQTNDDNQDGLVNEFDIPDVIFVANKSTPYDVDWSGLVRIVSGADGSELRAFSHVMDINGAAHLSVGDIDGDGEIEIIAPGISGLYAFDLDGSIKWYIDGLITLTTYLADIDSNGSVEIITHDHVLDSNGGVILQVGDGGYPLVVDHDVDGVNEIMFGGSLYNLDGTLILQTMHPYDGLRSGKNGFANFDDDEFPEYVQVVDGRIDLFDHTGEFLWRRDVVGVANGGAPVIADFTGDGVPEIGVAGRTTYTAIDAQGNTIWNTSVSDHSSSSTGSSVFDFDGDGRAEIVYADENTLHVFDAATGAVLFDAPHGSGTLTEYPTIVDIDNDNHAEIIVAQNDYLGGGFNGIRVYEDVQDEWMPTRGIWNQYAYHIDHVNSDGTIPLNSGNSWLTHNTFRLNSFRDIPSRGLVDLRAGDIQFDLETNQLSVSIRNVGQGHLKQQADVRFYNGLPESGGMLLASSSITDLLVGDVRIVSVDYPVTNISHDIVVVVDESGVIDECQRRNNISTAAFLQVNVSDPSLLSDTQSFFLNIHNQNEAPSFIGSVGSFSVVAGEIFSFTATAQDVDLGDHIIYALENAPAGMQINAATGEVTWATHLNDAGVVSFDLIVEDLSGERDLLPVTLTIRSNSAPEFSAEADAIVPENTIYQYALQVFDPDGDDLTYALDFSPSNASIVSSSGVVNWPVSDDVQSINLLNTNCYRPAAEDGVSVPLPDLRVGELIYSESGNRLSFNVRNVGLAPMAANVAADVFLEYGNSEWYAHLTHLPALASNEVTSVSIDNFPLINSVGVIPNHVRVELNSNGREECNAANNIARARAFSAIVTDSYGLEARHSWLLNIVDTNEAPEVPVIDISNIPAGAEWVFQVPVVDADIGDGHFYELNSAPPTMSLDSYSGLVRWMPTLEDVGEHSIEVQVTDLSGEIGTAIFSIVVVSPDNIAPIAFNLLVDANEDQSVEIQLLGEDENNGTLGYSVATSPINGSLSGTAPNLTYTPSANFYGQDSFSFFVNDGELNSNIATVLIEVNSINDAPEILNLDSRYSIDVSETLSVYIETFDPDIGDIHSYSLLEGPPGIEVSASGIVSWQPGSGEVGEHNVVIQVTDLAGDSVISSFIVVVAPMENSAPIAYDAIFDSSEDVSFNALLHALDSEGDGLTYELLTSPVNGVLSGTAPDLTYTPNVNFYGSDAFTFRVNDGALNSNIATVTINVSPVNDPPEITSGPLLSVSEESAYYYQVETFDPDLDMLTYQLLSSPAGMGVSVTGLISWTPGVGDQGDHNVTVRVSDGESDVDQSFVLSVLDSTILPLVVDVSVSDSVINIGESALVMVSTENALPGAVVTATLNGVELPLDASGQASVSPAVAGLYVIVATANDGREPITGTVNFNVVDPADVSPPSVTLHAPLAGSDITTITDVVVSVSDENLESYRVVYKRKSDTRWNTLVTGSTEVINTTVAEFDPSLLSNGIYQIVVEGRDLNGQTAQDSAFVVVDGDLKVGNFSFTVNDLSIPLAGIPIEVNRTYDSRHRHEGLDFGFGWSINYQNVSVEESRIPGSGWELNEYRTGPLGVLREYCVEPLGAPLVTVTLPNGNVERFEVVASPRCMESVAVFNVDLEFVAIGGTQSSLTAIGASGGRLVSDRIEFLGEGFPIDPFRYVLTTRSGYIYHLNQNFGIEMVEDPSGHTLTYSDSGIVHSSGKSISFVRNSDGVISEVIDPKGHAIVYGYDANGDLRTVTDRDTTDTQYTYNSNHGLVDIIDPLNRRVLRNIYDDNGRLTGQCDQNDVCKTFNHDIDARTSIVTDLDGRSTLFNYDDRGNVTEDVKIIADGNYSGDIVTTYTYDANDNQETKTIGVSTWTTLHNDNDDVTSACNPLNECVAYTDYNTRGQEGTITDERGNSYTMIYDGAGNLTQVLSPEIIDPDSGSVDQPVATNEVNAQGQITSTTDLRGLTTTYTYYPSGHTNAGQKHTESNPVSGTTIYTYDANNNVETETRQRTVNGLLVNETTTYTYDARDRVTRTTFHDGTYTEAEYDLAGNVDRERDRFGNWTDYDYDAYGRVTRTDYPGGSFEIRTYTNEGLLDTVTDRSGRVTRNEYDDAGRLWRVHNDSDGTYTETRYNDHGWVIAEYDALRNLTEYEYDLAGRRTAVVRHIDGSTQRHEFTYYPNGELHTETDANGHTITYILNELDQRIEVQYHNSTTMQERFDFMGTRTASIDQETRRTAFAYDDLGRLTGVTPQVNIDGVSVPETSYTYDEVGNKLTQTDAEGRTTTWTYDLHGRVLTRTLPLLQQESFVYTDGQGCQPDAGINCASTTSPRLTVHTDFNGDTITSAYDVMGRVIAIVYSKDGNSEVFTYYDNDQVHTVTDQHGTTEYIYDVNNRLDTEIKTDGSQIRYDYDAVGNRTLVEITRGGSITSSTTYTYDNLNRLEDVIDSSGTTTYTYDAVGNLDTVTYPNGLVTDYNYNSINQLTDVYTRDPLNTIISHFNYSLTATGRREIITELDGRTTAYCYDDLYRLTDEVIFETAPTTPPLSGCITDTTEASYIASYEYDMVGNRDYETVDGVQTAYSYDDNDRLTQTGGTIYGYDNNGNTLTETLDGNVLTYTWDGKNKLISVDDSVNTTSYEYNYNGIRISKTDGVTNTQFIVDENTQYAQVLEEVVDGTQVVAYSYGHDLVSQERDSQYYFYHVDGLGSTRALSDDIGAITDTWDFSGYGELLGTTGSTENNYLFTGEQFDSSLNQVYLRSRYYKPGIGRFTQMDSWEGRSCKPISLNKYLYTESDPVNGIDPTGKYTSVVGIGAGLAAMGILATTAQVNYQNSTSDGTSSFSIGPGDSTLLLAKIYFSYIDNINIFSLANDILLNSSSDSGSDAAQRQADYEAYKYGPCDPRNQIPPPGLSPCEAARWKLNVVKRCRDMRQDWDDRWQPGRHAEEIDNIGRWIVKLERIVERVCN